MVDYDKEIDRVPLIYIVQYICSTEVPLVVSTVEKFTFFVKKLLI